MFFVDFNYPKNKGINFIRLPVSNQTQIEATFVYLATLYKDKLEEFLREKKDVLGNKGEFVPMEEIQNKLIFEEIQRIKPFPENFEEEDVRCVVALKKILDIVWKLQRHVVTSLYSTEETLGYFLDYKHRRAFKIKIKELTPQEFGEWMMSELFRFIPHERQVA